MRAQTHVTNCDFTSPFPWRSSVISTLGGEVKKPYVKPLIRSRSTRVGQIEAGARFGQKRAVPRYPFSALATISEPIIRTQHSGLISDISLKGCFVESIDQLAYGTVIVIRLERSGQPFQSWGRIAHVHAGHGTGIVFFETSSDQQIILEGWIVELSKLFDQAPR
jgi:PilZ domain